MTSLDKNGQTASVPFNTTVIPTPTTSLDPASSSLSPSVPSPSAGPSDSIFVPIAIDAPPSNIPVRSDPVVPRLGIEHTSGPLATNKFYSNSSSVTKAGKAGRIPIPSPEGKERKGTCKQLGLRHCTR